jgi:hypothetical protein
MSKDEIICPWSVLETLILQFKHCPDDEKFENILNMFEKHSHHSDFWKKIFYSYVYIDKYEKATKLIQYLENENEKLNELLDLNVRKNT